MSHNHDSDSTSSFGDDDMSDNEDISSNVFGAAGHEETNAGLPDAFAGQEVEDLEYGAGPLGAHLEEEPVRAWWDEEEEDEVSFLSHVPEHYLYAHHVDIHITAFWL